MDFTREPIIETVITPREGCKLVVRSSKGPGQEEFFVDALEVVSFGNTFFFRSLERPKSFIVPTSDYEVLEVREARMVLKNVGTERTIKIAGGREPSHREKEQPPKAAASTEEAKPSDKDTSKLDKKRDRRRNARKRRGRRDEAAADSEQDEQTDASTAQGGEDEKPEDQHVGSSIVSTLLPPPPTLISESLQRYKRMEFFPPEEEALPELEDDFEEKELEETIPVASVEQDYEEFSEEAIDEQNHAAVKPEEEDPK